MPSRTKKQAKQIVVRTIEPGTRRATKAVFETLTELNTHKPLAELDPIDWTFAQPKPWKQPKSRPASCRPQAPRRNPGRADGKTWKSAQFVCGNAIGAAENVEDSDVIYRMDVEPELIQEAFEWAWAEDAGAEGDAWGHDRPQERREVSIMDIAKPMKPRGISKEFEVVKTVRRVIALEEGQASDLTGRTALDPELDEWEVLEQEDIRQPPGSYAESVQIRYH